MAGFKSSQFDSAGLTLSHCAFISQVWPWENRNLGKGVSPHQDTVTIAQAKTKTAQWISHDGKRLCLCGGGGSGMGGNVIYTHVRETIISCWPPSYSFEHKTEIIKHRTPASPVRGCSTERLESGCILPSQLPQPCPFHFVRILSRTDLATVVLSPCPLRNFTISLFHNYRTQYFGKVKHSNIKYKLDQKTAKGYTTK